VTTFKNGDVRWPAISADGKVIMFEHDFGIWKLDVNTKRATEIKLNIDAETQENLSEMQSFSSQADDYDLAPNSRHIVVSIHGEIFTAPVEEAISNRSPTAPRAIATLLIHRTASGSRMVSDQSGREELFVVPVDGSAPATQVTDIDALKNAYNWSPDSKEIAFTSSDDKLRKLAVATKQVTELDSSHYGVSARRSGRPTASGFAYSKQDVSRTSDVYMISAAGTDKEPHKLTFDSSNDGNPHFRPDGRKLFFQRVEARRATTAISQIYSVWLEHRSAIRTIAEEREAASDSPPAGGKRLKAHRAPRPVRKRIVRRARSRWIGMV
jgi:tricorn protease